MSRGQSTVEFALVVPFIAGLLALTLQGGLVISDQVNLQHYAYDAGQWAQANPTQGTPDTSGGPGPISQHVYDILCAPGKTPSTLGATQPLTRFCTSDLTVQVIDQQTPTSVDLTHDASLAGIVKCAVRTQPWTLSVSPSGPRTVNNSVSGGSLSYTVKVSPVTAPSPSPSTAPTPLPSPTPQAAATVRVTASAQPAPVGGGVALDQAYLVPGGDDTANMTWTYSVKTKPGVYNVKVSGIDQCGVAQTQSVQVTVGPATVSPAPTPPVTQWVDTVNPPQPCATISQTLDITGGGFVPGVTVQISGVYGTVTSVGPKKIRATFASLTAGAPQTVTVTWPDGTKAFVVGAVTPVATCIAAASPSPAPSPPCESSAAPNSGAAGVANELKVVVSWKEPVVIPLFGGNGLSLSATAYVFCS